MWPLCVWQPRSTLLVAFIAVGKFAHSFLINSPSFVHISIALNYFFNICRWLFFTKSFQSVPLWRLWSNKWAFQKKHTLFLFALRKSKFWFVESVPVSAWVVANIGLRLPISEIFHAKNSCYALFCHCFAGSLSFVFFLKSRSFVSNKHAITILGPKSGKAARCA